MPASRAIPSGRAPITPGAPPWAPESQLALFAERISAVTGESFSEYDDLWRWSVEKPELFWRSIWEYFDVAADGDSSVAFEHPGNFFDPGWFPGTRLSYAEHALRLGDEESSALAIVDESGTDERITFGELRRDVAAYQAAFIANGVVIGDRIIGYLPNGREAIVAFLAATSIGAIWSCCSPEIGSDAALQRFAQIEPVALVGVDGYSFGGRTFDRSETLTDLADGLPTLQTRFVVRSGIHPTPPDLPEFEEWAGVAKVSSPPQFMRVPFDHPLWILFSSGTTGIPKAIVHSHGGALLEHLKVLSLHNDVHKGDTFFWYSSTSWMMWNYLIAGLLHGAEVVVYAGSPTYPSLDCQWDIVRRLGVTVFGTGAGYLTACASAPGFEIGVAAQTQLRWVGSTGSPLPPEAHRRIAAQLPPGAMIASASGGTEIASGFLAGCALRPSVPGELQCRALGAGVEARDETGSAVIDSVGELVVTAPMPSMPLRLWGDADGSRLRSAFFGGQPGVWTHGDWITITDRGTAIVHGRSDATLNRGGVRIGTAEVYQAIAVVPEIEDSLILGIELPDGSYWMPMFVATREGIELDDALVEKIRHALRTGASPRHLPDEIRQMPAIPYSKTGKKLEVPLKRLAQGGRWEDFQSSGVVADLDLARLYAKILAAGRKREAV